MFRLNDPILIPHLDFLRSFFVDPPISGGRPLPADTGLVAVLCTGLSNKRSPPGPADSAATRRLKTFPRNYRIEERGEGETLTPLSSDITPRDIMRGQWLPAPAPRTHPDTATEDDTLHKRSQYLSCTKI